MLEEFGYQDMLVDMPLETEHASDSIPDLLLVFRSSLSPHLGSLDVGGTFVVGLC